jgi:hypothetical protein
MAQAIQLTLSEEEAREVLSAVKGSAGMMRRDSRHDKDRAILERVAIMLDAHLKVAQSYGR